MTDAVNDKFKCFYTLSPQAEDEMIGFEDRTNTKTKKLPVRIMNLPLGYDGGGEGKSSVVKSLSHTQSNFMSKTRYPTTLEGAIKDREDRLVHFFYYC